MDSNADGQQRPPRDGKNRRGNTSGAGGGAGGAGRGGRGARRSGGGPQRRRPGAGSGANTNPVEVAARVTRNALNRHAEGIRDDDTRLACRVLIGAIVGAAGRLSSPAELLAMIEQCVQVAEATRPDFSQLPATLRASIGFATETPRRTRDVLEMLRLCLRHGYALASDHIPRQIRNDGAFRASALAEALSDAARNYLDDTKFAQAAKR